MTQTWCKFLFLFSVSLISCPSVRPSIHPSVCLPIYIFANYSALLVVFFNESVSFCMWLKEKDEFMLSGVPKMCLCPKTRFYGTPDDLWYWYESWTSNVFWCWSNIFIDAFHQCKTLCILSIFGTKERFFGTLYIQF